MTGAKKEIARHTINVILETLGPNDFVSIIQFNDKAKPIGKCFGFNLVQVLTSVSQLI